MQRGGALGSTLGAVLVGGQSRRMGSPKALLEVGGVPMAVRVADAMSGAGIERVVAVGPARFAAGLDHVEDEYPGEGPLGGVITALHAAAGDSVLVVACDLPWMSVDALRLLMTGDTVDAAGAVDVVAARSDVLEPMCALWRPSALEVLERSFAAGERSVHRPIERLRSRLVTLPTSVLRNVNTPHDLPRE